ncbi:inositol monophosphatase family protein [Loktanella sp. SALINAS62]|uniref:inositol monophosphatase family protein n=1 Tax=Loktanella sp. SALINAS62 TaxID=2706124 RepID=UPI001B8CFD2B|nr:inositol monophosphatase family protein [Loktanella sp. SALINAS62]MBS1301885.1 inositol monophosphatase [Loktanella sp. SALINAS62]
MTDAIIDRHAHACELARHAGAAALAFFNQRDTLAVEAKASPQDVVSRADREVEVLIRNAISKSYPKDAIIGEEDAPKPGTSGFTWVIDPIDGTMPFLSGLPHWCVAIAVVENDRAVAAATFAPVHDLLYDARLGGGFRCGGVLQQISSDLAITDAMTAIGASHRTPATDAAGVIEKLLRAGGAYYRNGSGAMMLADVAAGRLAGYFEPHMNAWDCLGGLLMIEEAGGRSQGFAMGDMLTRGGRVLAAAPRVFDALADIGADVSA